MVEAVNEFLSHILSRSAIRKITALGVLPPARALSIEYTAAIQWDDEIDIKIIISDVSKRSFTFAAEAVNAEEIVSA